MSADRFSNDQEFTPSQWTEEQMQRGEHETPFWNTVGVLTVLGGTLYLIKDELLKLLGH